MPLILSLYVYNQFLGNLVGGNWEYTEGDAYKVCPKRLMNVGNFKAFLNLYGGRKFVASCVRFKIYSILA